MPTEKKQFTQKEVAALLDINANTIAQYARKELVIADIENPKGRGHTRLYSRLNLLEFLFLQELARCGFTHDKIENINFKLKFEATSETYEKKDNDFITHLLKNINTISWAEILLKTSRQISKGLYVVIVNPYEKNYKLEMRPYIVTLEKQDDFIALMLKTRTPYDIEEKPINNLLIINITPLYDKIKAI
ncbi:MerR family transcriptional regulator [Candidatus Latescibacterota bacterium]